MKRRFTVLAGVTAGSLLFGPPRWASAEVRLDAEFFAMLSAPLTATAAPRALTDRAGKLALMVKLPLGADAEAMGLRWVAPGLGTARVAPRDLSSFEAAHPGVSYSVWPPFHPVLDQSARLNGALAYRAALAAAGMIDVGRGRGVVVGIVDTGLDVAHADFRDASGKTRVAWLLDFAHAALGRHADLETRYGCSDAKQSPCAVLNAADIDQALTGSSALYRPTDKEGHGTHVASIAAGNGGTAKRFVGGAPESTLVVAGVGGGPSGSFVDADIIEGVQFIFDRAGELKLPAVVNISLGSDFGPHDGTTPIEQALASMVGSDHPGRAIIVAAGNSGARYEGDVPEEALGVHTQTRVTRGVAARASVVSPNHAGGAPLDGSGYIWITYGAHDDIRVAFDGPGGLSVPAAAMGAKSAASSADGTLSAAIYNGVLSSDVPLTKDTHGAIVIWQGSWAAGTNFTLGFEGEGFVDAWLESAPDGALFDLATTEGTINVPATHPAMIAVGCTVNRTQWTDATGHDYNVAASPSLELLSPVDSPCYFSSAGPTATGVAKPELSAPGAMVAAAMSQDAVPKMGSSSPFDAPAGLCVGSAPCLLVDATHALLSGSSMSAPQVTGATALLLERDPTLTQPEILSLLQQGARKPRGPVDYSYQLGAGALDVSGAAAALQMRSTAMRTEPDAQASWVSLSSAYLRSEPQFAVVGTVEVRARDGQVADGFEEGRLTLQVGQAGVVQQALARVAPGLWRFALTSLPHSLESSVPVSVRLDGVPVAAGDAALSGERNLPIGPDRWLAFGSVRAFGGCAYSPASPRNGWWRWVLVATVLAAARLRDAGPRVGSARARPGRVSSVRPGRAGSARARGAGG